MPLTQIKTSNLDSNNSINFRNRIINGDMRIDQRNAGSAFTHGGSQGYNVDRWVGQNSTDGTLTAQRVTDAPAGFTNSLKYTATATDTSLAAGQYAFTLQKIEGYNVADLAFGTASAQTVTISFWTKSSLTGTFSGALCNLNFDRSYSFTYTINSANTWEYKTVTISGDTTGTWQTDTTGSFQVIWSLGCGSTYTTTPNVWTAAGSLAATGQVNVMNTLNATWQITGVQLEAGTAATAFERRSYGIELILCQRYFEKTYSMNTVPGTATESNVDWYGTHAQSLASTGTFQFQARPFKVVKRAAPTMAFWDMAGNSGKWTRYLVGGGPNQNNAITVDTMDDSGFRAFVAGTASTSNVTGHWTASAEL